MNPRREEEAELEVRVLASDVSYCGRMGKVCQLQIVGL